MASTSQPGEQAGREQRSKGRAPPPPRGPVTTPGATPVRRPGEAPRAQGRCFSTSLNTSAERRGRGSREPGDAQTAPGMTSATPSTARFYRRVHAGDYLVPFSPQVPRWGALGGSCLAHCAFPTSTSLLANRAAGALEAVATARCNAPYWRENKDSPRHGEGLS